MAKARKDERGRALRKGEVQRASDKRYMYSYTDPLGRRKFIYANDLATLREKEKQLVKDQLDGLDLYAAGKATVNDTFDRYLSTKHDLRATTRSNYIYMYDRFIRDTFGKKKIAAVKYSDVLQFYYHLLNEKDLSLSTLDSVHTLLHPTFQLAVRDEVIRKNPSDGVMKEVSKGSDKSRGVRHALTIEQQRAFMNYIAEHPVYYHWWPCSQCCWGPAAESVKHWDCVGRILISKRERSTSTIAWFIIRWVIRELRCSEYLNQRQKPAFGRFLCWMLCVTLSRWSATNKRKVATAKWRLMG